MASMATVTTGHWLLWPLWLVVNDGHYSHFGQLQIMAIMTSLYSCKCWVFWPLWPAEANLQCMISCTLLCTPLYSYLCTQSFQGMLLANNKTIFYILSVKQTYWHLSNNTLKMSLKNQQLNSRDFPLNHWICDHDQTRQGGGSAGGDHIILGFFLCSKPSWLALLSLKTNFVLI